MLQEASSCDGRRGCGKLLARLPRCGRSTRRPVGNCVRPRWDAGSSLQHQGDQGKHPDWRPSTASTLVGCKRDAAGVKPLVRVVDTAIRSKSCFPCALPCPMEAETP